MCWCYTSTNCFLFVVPTKIRKLRVTSVGTDHMTVAWDVQRRPRLHVDLYEICYWAGNDVSSVAFNTTTSANFTLSHLIQGTKYSFKVSRSPYLFYFIYLLSGSYITKNGKLTKNVNATRKINTMVCHQQYVGRKV